MKLRMFEYGAGLTLLMVAVVPGDCRAQGMVGNRLRVAAIEPVREAELPQLSLQITTERAYGCSNFRLDARLSRAKDTLRIEVKGLAPETLCDNAFGPAGIGFPLSLGNGSYPLEIRRDTLVDSLILTVSATRLDLRTQGASVLTLPDTAPFWRAPAQSFVLACGTYKAPALCADIGAWIERQADVRPIVFPVGGRVAFSMGEEIERHYYQYGNALSLAKLRRCMQEVQRRVAEAVGVSISVHLANGESMRAWSSRSFYERHINTPLRVTDSPEC